MVEQPFFDVPAHVYRLENGELQSYEFPNDRRGARGLKRFARRKLDR